MIPKDIKDLIKNDRVPGVLKKPLSMSTYKDYFAALLYAEDFYIEKWSKFKLENITLKLQQASIFKLSSFSESHEKDNKTLVTFEIDSCHERRPFLLSRDYVFARPSGNKTEPFQGVIYRVVRSTTVLVEFSEDFYAQHHSSRRYDVSFSFNRVCLKRAHQAVEAASDPLFKSYIFPDCDLRRRHPASSTAYFNYKLDADQTSAVRQILAFQGPPPYLIEGPLCVTKAKRNECRQLSKTGLVIQEAVREIYRSSQKHRVLLCAPINSTCDLLTSSLKKHIPKSEIFRANAAFREIDGVPTDILPSCIYEGECFSCPRLQELQKYRVILSTYVSSFRLHNEGIAAGHFSHIFLVDASSATEPEAMVALANLANEKTAVIVTGAPGNRSGWVRSDIARKNGLKDSYFERLRERNPYNRLDSMFITELRVDFSLQNASKLVQYPKVARSINLKPSYFTENNKKDDKTFVTFEIDSCHERRPFLLSRDFAFARPSRNKTGPFQGVICRVVRSTTVLVEFGEDFYAQHHSSRRYDVSFSFNRVCLKRAHQAVEAVSGPLFKSYIFPDCDFRRRHPASSTAYFNYKLDADQTSAELRKYRVILSTYVSSFRLCNEGIAAGHFSHIFLVDASSATEPEAMVALANLANEKTAVIVTGAPGNHSGWVHSDIARKNGLMDSYFERLCKRNPYNRLDSMFITKLDSVERKSDDTDSFQSFSFY
ncbi:hypothetical protein GH714_035396 [Hevea brasiliensis]|uniref:Helicase MOV-10-like beta-barrel domain-containing protein n=1 Tax=Hevea brasiliensis TaxID=3981 RepID=A0A6A6L6P5_HEVBR|nr:hypothetical protein GH714_035396 [Hevea brasiliensis]